MRQFRFGVLAQHVAPTREAWVETARRVEDLGYSTLFVADHLNHPFAPFSAVALAGEATRTLRLGTYVLANDYRHPVMLAKELATLDVLSGGRLEVGLGTGYRKDDYDQSGMQLDSPRVRVDRFLEGLRIVKGFFSGEPFSFSGQYYAVKNLVGKPKPLQRPRPPILIGAGSRRMLSIAAREADIIGVNPRTSEGRLDLASMTARTAVEKIKSLREVAGSRIGDVELNTYARLVAVTNHPRDAAESVIREWWSSTRKGTRDIWPLVPRHLRRELRRVRAGSRATCGTLITVATRLGDGRPSTGGLAVTLLGLAIGLRRRRAQEAGSDSIIP